MELFPFKLLCGFSLLIGCRVIHIARYKSSFVHPFSRSYFQFGAVRNNLLCIFSTGPAFLCNTFIISWIDTSDGVFCEGQPKGLSSCLEGAEGLLGVLWACFFFFFFNSSDEIQCGF